MNLICLIKDRFLKSNISKNFLVVFLGDGFSSVLTLLNLSIMVKILGLNESSIVNLVIAYTLVFDTIFNFQSFNAIIKFVPKAIINKNFEIVKSYFKQGFILDLVTAFISFLFANLLLEFLCYIFKWDRIVIDLIRVYSLSILFNITGTSIGIIRVYNKFKYSSYINVFVNSLKFIFYVMSFIVRVNMWYFITVELVFTLLNMVMLFIVTRYILIKNNINGVFRNKSPWDKEFLKFNFYCNFMTTLDVPISHLTPFLINSFVGIEFISVYKIIEKIGGIVSKVASPLVNIIYPEISTKVSQNDESSAINLVKKLFFIIISFGIFITIFLGITSRLWVNILISDGNKYLFNILFYIIFVVVKFSFVGVYPLFISLGYIKYNIYIVVVANLIYLGVMPFFSSNFNINGVIISQCIQVFIVICAQIFFMRRRIFSTKFQAQ